MAKEECAKGKDSGRSLQFLEQNSKTQKRRMTAQDKLRELNSKIDKTKLKRVLQEEREKKEAEPNHVEKVSEDGVGEGGEEEAINGAAVKEELSGKDRKR